MRTQYFDYVQQCYNPKELGDGAAEVRDETDAMMLEDGFDPVGEWYNEEGDSGEEMMCRDYRKLARFPK